MSDELIIASYGSHNAAIVMYYKGNYTVIEVERWLSKKNAGLVTYMPAAHPKLVFDEITDYLLSQTDRSEVDLYLTNYNDLKKLTPKFSYKKHRAFDHHEAHAATAFYQSPYEEAITFTFDGGGDLGFFNVYKTDRRNGVQLLERFNQDLGFAYMIIADHLEDIRRDPLNIGNLVYAGKLMGLCSYGNVREEWIPAFMEFYETFNYHGDSYIGGAEAAKDALPKLMEDIGVENFTSKTRFEGQFAWDLAATTQYVFEEQFYRFARPYLDKYPDMPITLAGGCALNVILNARLLKERNGKVFVPPNTNDCGIAVGGILLYQKPEHQVDLTYSGCPILDEHLLMSYIESNAFTVIDGVQTKDLAKYISLGNIVGVINGNSEHGPRALGNRSIICNPVGDMKDVLNKKVKDREWYRPFAPLVRLEDATTYFDFPEGAQSRHMTYVAEVREEYRDVIPAVTHEDGTGRLQTVTKQQNPFIYDLLTEFSKISDHSVLLNTSFNVNGKPILTRLSEALEILLTTKLDAVYYKDKLIFRKGEEANYTDKIVSENIQPLDESTTMYLMVTPQDLNACGEQYTSKIREMLDAVSKDKRKAVIVAEPQHMPLLKNVFGDETKYMELDSRFKYYYEFFEDYLPDFKLSISSGSKILRMLWAKNLMYENVYRTRNHMFVSVDAFIDNSTIGSDLKKLLNLVNDVDTLVVNSGKYDGIMTTEQLKSFVQYAEIPDEAPLFDLVWGSYEEIEWLSVNIEAHLLNLLRRGIQATDVDYGLIPYVQTPERFRMF